MLERVGDGAELVELGAKRLVLGAETPRERGARFVERRRVAAAGREGTQGVEDDGDVDGFLEDRAPHGREQAERRGDHGRTGHGHPGDHTLRRDRPGAVGDGEAVREVVETVDGEDHVGGFRRGGRATGADRDAHVGERQRGRVVDAVADHDRGPVPARFHDCFDLLCGGAFGEHGVHTDDRADGFGDVGPVAGDHLDAADAAAAQRPDGAGCVGAQRVVQHDRACGRAVDGDEHGQRAVQVGPPVDGTNPDRRRAVGEDPARLAHRHLVSVDAAAHAVGGDLLDIDGKGELGSPDAGAADHRRGQHVGRHLLERGRRPQQLVGLHPPRGDHLRDGRTPLGEGARLVQQQDRRPGETLERTTTLDDDPESSRPRQARDDRHRRGEDQRARCGHHQNGHGPHRVTGDRPRRAGETEADEQEPAGEAVRHAHEGCARRLGLLDQAHDTGVGAPCGRGARPQVECVPGVDRSAPHRIRSWMFDRQRLAGECRFVDHRHRGFDEPVDGQHLAGPHEQQIPGLDVRQCRFGQGALHVAVHGPGRAIDQRPEVPLGTSAGSGLDHATAGQHHRDDRSGEVLADGERTEQRQDRDHVDAESTFAGRARHPEQGRADSGHGGRGPHHVPGAVLAGSGQRASRGEPRERDREQRGLGGAAAARRHWPRAYGTA